MTYFCLIVLLSCKIPSSSESQDDCSECIESFYYEKGWVCRAFAYYLHQSAACYSSASTCTREGKHYWKGEIKAQNIDGKRCYGFPGQATCWKLGEEKTKIRSDLGRWPIEYIWLDPNPLVATSGPLTLSPGPGFKGRYDQLQGSLKDELKVPTVENNLFIHLAEQVTRELGIANYWVCGGALMSETWP